MLVIVVWHVQFGSLGIKSYDPYFIVKPKEEIIKKSKQDMQCVP